MTDNQTTTPTSVDGGEDAESAAKLNEISQAVGC